MIPSHFALRNKKTREIYMQLRDGCKPVPRLYLNVYGALNAREKFKASKDWEIVEIELTIKGSIPQCG